MSFPLTRRQVLAAGGAGALSLAAGSIQAAEPSTSAAQEPFRYSLNTATLMGHKLAIVEEVEIAAKAGYTGIEPWIGKLRQYAEGGGSLADLRKRIADRGLAVEGAIGFVAWAVDDDARRAKALEEFQRDLELVGAIGGRRMAASPAGINRTAGVDLFQVAKRYRKVLELAARQGMTAQLEIWGSSLTLSRISEAALVATQADHPAACLLLDVFHLYRGGGGFHGLKLLNGAAMPAFHVNDYPADPPREKISDSARVYPGDGVAPLGQIFRDLRASGFRGALSLELFNQDYWKQEPLAVAQTGLEKTRAAVRRALAG